MSIYDVIHDDHRKLEQLLEDIRDASDPDDRYALFEALREEFTVHARAEEEVLYRRLRGRLPDRTKEAYRAHEDIFTLCAQIAELEPRHARVIELVGTLERSLRQHVRDDDARLLPEARKLLGDDADNALAMELHHAKRRLPDQQVEPV